MSIDKSKWKWFGLAGHFICASHCRFHLCTQVGKYVVSSVGQYWPERAVREIHARVVDPGWHAKNQYLMGDSYDQAYMERFGFEQIGAGRTFETMVFKASKLCNSKDCNCGQPTIIPTELEAIAANSVKEATSNHMKLCRKWAKK